ncbi:hypothetical protein DMH04_41830 [Kibdelosporangium aridum]|uniref:Uncharacterized protein n=1 Tax=Kibdelosporangium aridum TaxID=2030 RepID=A0A428YTW7_KIBAR|nr:hypothetical protein [Kibdelosporangium aridum]RSM73029.1 hypothetical protein DMH04_41830 [Kibdelosporangium aridum]
MSDEAQPRLVEAHETEPVQDVEAWATVVVARRALDTLRSARVRREQYVGPWLPEPWLQGPDPAERSAWVLHDLFGMEFTLGLAIAGTDRFDFVLSLTVDNDRVSRVDFVRAPEKLASLRKGTR